MAIENFKLPDFTMTALCAAIGEIAAGLLGAEQDRKILGQKNWGLDRLPPVTMGYHGLPMSYHWLLWVTERRGGNVCGECGRTWGIEN